MVKQVWDERVGLELCLFDDDTIICSGYYFNVVNSIDLRSTKCNWEVKQNGFVNNLCSLSGYDDKHLLCSHTDREEKDSRLLFLF